MCDRGQHLFQLDLQSDDNPCETSWILERLPDSNQEEEEEAVYVGGHGNGHALSLNGHLDREYDVMLDDHFGASNAGDATRCLDPGRYRFTIFDAFGDGIATPGYYLVALDGVVLAGSSDFGYEEKTLFTVIRSKDSSADSEDSSQTTAEDGMTGDGEMIIIIDNRTIPIPDRLVGLVELPSEGEEDTYPPPTASPNDNSTSMDANREEAVEEDDILYEETYASLTMTTSNQTSLLSTWAELLDEDFKRDDLGYFNAMSDEYVTYYPLVKERRGVVRLQGAGRGIMPSSSPSSSAIYSDDIIPILQNFDDIEEVRLVFSFYANSMESTDGFCVDVSTDDGNSWRSERCWHAIRDFEDGMWYDDASVAFRLSKGGDERRYYVDGVGGGFRIRFRCRTDSLNDDILIDRVKLMGLVT